MIRNIIIYLGHPAQYHFIKHTIIQLKRDGFNVVVLIKTKDILETLLKEDDVEFINIQDKVRGNTKKDILLASFKRTWAVYKIARKHKADLLIGTDASIAQAAKLLGKPAITTLEDDVEIIINLAKLTYPFTTDILVPTPCRVGKWEKKKIGYEGYMKLAYLHPNYFTPQKNIIEKYNISGKYCLIRLAKLTAHHDKGIKGLNIKLVTDIIGTAEKYGYRVYISAEGDIDEALKPYQLRIKHTDIHHVMAFASLLISDSQSMSVEAAMLGLPSLRFSDFSGRISVLEELEKKYNLTFGIKTSEPDELLKKMTEILSLQDCQKVYQERREKMLSEKIDVTAFLTWFIEKYPESRKTMKDNPDYQFKFR